MPNKTIYVRDSDLSLWAKAQSELGESVSSLFSKFLKERLQKIDMFVHVLHTIRPGSQDDQDFTVMFAPIDKNGPMKPHYLRGIQQMTAFLNEAGLSQNEIEQIKSDLKKNASSSIISSLSSSIGNTSYYLLHFRPTLIRGDENQRLLKVDAIGIPVSGSRKEWRANFHSLEDLLNSLAEKFDLPAPQLHAIRRSLLLGEEVELGGMTGVPYVVPEQKLNDLGMVKTE